MPEIESSDEVRKYRVWMRSTPGFYEQYAGKVDVVARDEEHAIDRAFAELKRGASPERGRSMWKVEKVERLMEHAQHAGLGLGF